MVPLMTIKAS